LDIGDVFGPYTVTNLTRIYDDQSDKKQANSLEIRGTFDPAVPLDIAASEITYIIEDSRGSALPFHIPAGSFEPQGNPQHQRFMFDSANASNADIRARFDMLKCTFEVRVRKLAKTKIISGTDLTVSLQAGPNLGQETVQVDVRPQHLEYRKIPKLSCCQK
jgi:hypothetical protein